MNEPDPHIHRCPTCKRKTRAIYVYAAGVSMCFKCLLEKDNYYAHKVRDAELELKAWKVDNRLKDFTIRNTPFL